MEGKNARRLSMKSTHVQVGRWMRLMGEDETGQQRSLLSLSKSVFDNLGMRLNISLNRIADPAFNSIELATYLLLPKPLPFLKSCNFAP